MDTQLNNAITHLRQLLVERGIRGDITLNMANLEDFDRLHALLSAEAKPPVPLMDLEAFLSQSEVIGL